MTPKLKEIPRMQTVPKYMALEWNTWKKLTHLVLSYNFKLKECLPYIHFLFMCLYITFVLLYFDLFLKIY